MSQDTYFPINFLALAKGQGGPIPNGVYLRWLVKPYLGLSGVYPLHLRGEFGEEIGRCGFRIYFNPENNRIPDLQAAPLDRLTPEDRPKNLVDLLGYPGCKVVFPKDTEESEITFDLERFYKNSVSYLRIDYRLSSRQFLNLSYTIHCSSTQTDRKVEMPLHFPTLAERLKEGEQEKLAYAIQVDREDESITVVSLTSNKAILLEGIWVALTRDLPFFIWSPDQGGGIWEKIPPALHLLKSLDLDPIQPAPSSELVRAMREFYRVYYGIKPDQAVGNQEIHFRFPELPGFPLDRPLTREYLADQYRGLCDGHDAPTGGPGKSTAYLPPQEAVALASLDPAIAYLMGLFRVLVPDPMFQRPGVFKIQGTWPQGRRYSMFCEYDPTRTLGSPRMVTVNAASQKSQRVVRDYATFRTHHPINLAALTWKKIEFALDGRVARFGPVGYLVFRILKGQAGFTCRSSFYVPQAQETDPASGETRYEDWYDFYLGTDIKKVLDGDYTYFVGFFDLFGQLSNFSEAEVGLQPFRQEFGGIEKPEVTLSALPDPTDPDVFRQMDIPLELVEQDTEYSLKDFDRNCVELDYCFFWPWESSYVWDRNRATKQISLDYFRLLYLADIPVSTPVRFTIESNDADGLSIKLQGAAARGENRAIHTLLRKLGALDLQGSLTPGLAETALTGGSFIFKGEFEIVEVKVLAPQSTLLLRVVPAAPAEQEIMKKDKHYYPDYYPDIWYRLTDKQTAQVLWNTGAIHGGARLGWESLTAVGEKIKPATPRSYDGKLFSEIHPPSGQPCTPADLRYKTGILCYLLPADKDNAAENYSYVIRLPLGEELAQHRRLRIVPRDPAGQLQPGEFYKGDPPAGSDIEYPESVNLLFNEDLVASFYVTRVVDDPQYPGQVTFRGDPWSFVSRDPNTKGEHLIYPDPDHQHWLVIPPTLVQGKKVPLKTLLKDRQFGVDNFISTSMTVALEAVEAGLDREVKNTLYRSAATKKLTFVRYLPPPKIVLPGKPPPVFGTAAGPPDYHGTSLIRLETIYQDYDLRNKLTNNYQYVLYRLPTDRVMGGGSPVKYAKDPGGLYRRNLVDLKNSLEAFHSGDPLESQELQELFRDFGQKSAETPLAKEEFLQLPVELPGESRTVFLFAIKAYDPASQKESQDFVALSPPVYVEDPTPPRDPMVLNADFLLVPDAIRIYLKVARRLEQEPVFGYASEAELNQFSLLGPSLPHLVKHYRLYLSTRGDAELLSRPDDSDFFTFTDLSQTIGDPSLFSNFQINRFSLKISPNLLELKGMPNEPEQLEIRGTIPFSNFVKTKVAEIPARIYACLRAENYLGQLSPLRLQPMVLREAL